MNKTVEELAKELKARFGRMEPVGSDSWDWDWVPDPLAVEAADALLEMQSVLYDLGTATGYV